MFRKDLKAYHDIVVEKQRLAELDELRTSIHAEITKTLFEGKDSFYALYIKPQFRCPTISLMPLYHEIDRTKNVCIADEYDMVTELLKKLVQTMYPDSIVTIVFPPEEDMLALQRGAYLLIDWS